MGQFLSSVLHAFSVNDEGAITPYEANLCQLLEWTEGRALGKNKKKNPRWEQVKKNGFSDNIVTFIYIYSIMSI